MVYKRLSKTWLSERNVQVSFRQHNATADWYPGLTIEHRPLTGRSVFEDRYYEHRLRRAIDRQKHWVRYHWYLGYHQFIQNDHSLAERNLQWCL